MVAASLNPSESAANLLDTLTPYDASLLQNLFASGRDLFALARHHSLPLAQILAWLAQPHIAAARDLIAKELAEGLKSEALDILRHDARTSPDPVEQRRAATQILRALNPPQQRRPRIAPAPEGPAAFARGEGRIATEPLEPPCPVNRPGGAGEPTPSAALAELTAAEYFRSAVLNSYGEALDAQDDAELDDEAEDLDDPDEPHEIDTFLNSLKAATPAAQPPPTPHARGP